MRAFGRVHAGSSRVGGGAVLRAIRNSRGNPGGLTQSSARRTGPSPALLRDTREGRQRAASGSSRPFHFRYTPLQSVRGEFLPPSWLAWAGKENWLYARKND